MSEFPADIYTEPSNIDVDTLKNLGPLRAMAGIWQGQRGLDVKPKAEGPKKQSYVERMELQPIDPVSNGPQLLYGLRYLTHIVKPEQVKTYHEQVGYWLWESATGTVIHTLTIPRGQTVMAAGKASADATEFELLATRESDSFGICSIPFRSGSACLNSFTPRDKETAGGLNRCRVVHGGVRRLRRTQSRGGQLGAHQGFSF